MKKYKAIFFDWDGTAVKSRRASVEEVVVPMKALLAEGVKLAVISGTTIENIGEGELHKRFSVEERRNLFYGLGRGAYNYRFDEKGEVELFCDKIPDKSGMLDIHRACFDVHEHLLDKYSFPTDIVFSRPNYCKIDLMVTNSRGDNLFLQENELEALKSDLHRHGFVGGPAELIALAKNMGKKYGISLSATTDAKYLEVGVSSKSDNVDELLGFFQTKYGIQAEDCAFWGDEYIGVDEGLFGSDSFMITEKTMDGDFFDVSDLKGIRPEQVIVTGGGVGRFLRFLEEQK